MVAHFQLFCCFGHVPWAVWQDVLHLFFELAGLHDAQLVLGVGAVKRGPTDGVAGAVLLLLQRARLLWHQTRRTALPALAQRRLYVGRRWIQHGEGTLKRPPFEPGAGEGPTRPWRRSKLLASRGQPHLSAIRRLLVIVWAVQVGGQDDLLGHKAFIGKQAAAAGGGCWGLVLPVRIRMRRQFF